MRSMFRGVLVALVTVFALGAVASASASASVWEACLNGHTRTGAKYEDARCTKEAGTGEFEWLPIEKSYASTFEGGEQRIELTATKTVISCSGVTGAGSIAASGESEVSKLVYTGCKISTANCPIVRTKGQANGTVELAALKSKIVSAGDEIVPASGSTFAELEIAKEEKEGKAKGACGVLAVKDPLSGSIVAKVEGEALNFQGKGALTLFGLKAEYLGKMTQKLVGGNAYRQGPGVVWETCSNEKAGIDTKYEDAKCSKASGTGKFEWAPVEKAFGYTAKGGTQIFFLPAGVRIECSSLAEEGSITPEGDGAITSVAYHECRINLSGCPVVKSAGASNGTIAPPSFKTKLVTREAEGKQVMEDEITPGEGEEFFELEIGKEEEGGKAKGACGILPTKSEVKGIIDAKVVGEVLEYEGRGSLKWDGSPSTLEGEVTQKLENGSAFRTS